MFSDGALVWRSLGALLAMTTLACTGPARPCPANAATAGAPSTAQPPRPMPLPEDTAVPLVRDQEEEAPVTPRRDRWATRVIGPSIDERPLSSRRGARIDLDIRGADLSDVCRLLAEVGRVNIVVADEVQTRVTVRMKNVPWDEALSAIVRAKGLRAEREGNVILVLLGK